MTPTFTGEVQLAGWSESHTGGCKVVFWLSSPEELSAFRALTVRKGNTAGHRFMAALVEIGDDELPVIPEAVNPTQAERTGLGNACWRTVMWCKDPSFWAWASSTTKNGIFWHVNDEKSARDFVRELCGVESRSLLDTNNEANKTWHREIRQPYREYLNSQTTQPQ